MDFALDDNGDLALPVRLVTGVDAVKQSVNIRLRFFKGEWPLDTSAGIPYYQEILKKQSHGLRNVDAIFKSEILATPGVRSLLSWSSSVKQRRYSAQFRIDTIFGPVDMTWQE